MPIDELAKKRWLAHPADFRKMFEDNVFCSTCSVTTIVDYHVDSVNHKLVLRGRCKKCNRQVARVID